jgi:hypothetical protein
VQKLSAALPDILSTDGRSERSVILAWLLIGQPWGPSIPRSAAAMIRIFSDLYFFVLYFFLLYFFLANELRHWHIKTSSKKCVRPGRDNPRRFFCAGLRACVRAPSKKGLKP